MIRRFNRKQLLLAVISLLGAVVSYGCGWLFFRYVPGYAAGFYGQNFSPAVAAWIAIAGLATITVSGYRNWKSGGGLHGYHESALYHNLDPVSGGSMMMDIYAHRITGPAFVLSQVFLAGPMGLLKSRTLWQSRIPHDTGLERRLEATLSMLRQINKWQPMTEHPDHHQEILLLARMWKIDFSAIKGIPRIKAGIPTS